MEYKFRAWHWGVNEMLLPEEQEYAGKVFTWAAQGQPLEIMQWTGLKDKNGVEVYAGDLIESERGRVCKVVRQKYIAAFDTEFVRDGARDYDPEINYTYGFWPSLWHRHIQVIGNTFENPELMGSK